MRVCVIGAGFAGLVAATTLADRGVERLRALRPDLALADGGGEWAGHTEGALRSGLRAAGEVFGPATAALSTAGAP